MLSNLFKKKSTFLILVILLGVTMSGYYTYNYSQKACAYKYAQAYKQKQFDKLYKYYYQGSTIKRFSQQEIIGFLKQEWEIANKVNPEDLTLIKDPTSNKWFVDFPYSLQNINVLAPAGATIYLDNKKIVEGVKGKGITIKDLLPGKYGIRVEYYDNMYPAFTKEINVPQQTTVQSPYKAQDISVFAPQGTWVTVGGIKKQNTEDQVLFENILPGEYSVSLFMSDQTTQIFSKKIQISPEDTSIQIDKIEGNEGLRKDLQAFFHVFNQEYAKGIIEKDTLFLHKFLTDEINEELISDYKMWYIDNKDIEDAKSQMEIQEIHSISGDALKASVLETVYLTNKEEAGEGTSQQEYRVVIEWNYQLLRSNSTWKIISRDILQSIVAYKDEDGNWIKY